MPFIPKDWRNLPEETTPLSAEALEDMEVRLSNYTIESMAVVKEAPLNVRSDQGGAPVLGNGTDETTAILAKFAALPSTGGEIYFPPPPTAYRLTAPIPIAPTGGLVIRGASRGRSKIVNAVSDMFTVGTAGTVESLQFYDLELRSEVGGGHIIKQVGSLGPSELSIKAVQQNIAKSIWHADLADGKWPIEVLWNRCDLQHAPGLTPTVPGILLRNGGDINNNEFYKCRFTNSGAYFIHIEATGPSNYHSYNRIEACNFEACNGGMVKLINCFGFTMEDCQNWDSIIQGPMTNDAIFVGGAFRSMHIRLDGIFRIGGLLGTADTGTGDTTNLSFTVNNVVGLDADCVGRPISGPGIVANTTVRSLVGSTLTLSKRASASGTGVALTTSWVDIRLQTGSKAGKVLIQNCGDPDTGDFAVSLGSNNPILRNNTIAALGGEEAPTIASASTITLPIGGSRLFDVTGTTQINRIEPEGWVGETITLRFPNSSAITVADTTDNIRIIGNYISEASGTLTLVCNGIDWYEVDRHPDRKAAINVLDYGADPTGVTSSVAAFAAAVAACIPNTDPVTTARFAKRALYIPAGDYMTNTTALLSLTSVIGLRVFTDGPYATSFRADASMESIVDLNGIAHCHFDGFTCKSKSSGNDASVVVQKPFKMYWDNTTAARSTTNNRFEAIIISDCRFVRGAQFGLDGSGLQCDSTQIDRCSVVGQCGFGYGDVANTTSTLLNCNVTAMAIGHEIYGYGIQAGTTISNIVGSTITLSLPATASLTHSFIFSTVPGLWQRGINLGSGVAGNNYGHHITMAQAGNVRYGCYVANTSGVIEQWDGLTNQTDFFFAGVGDGCFAIKSGRGEGSQRMMDTTGASSLSSNIEISDMIWFGNRMHGDRGWVKYFSGGSVSLNRVKCYGLDTTQPITPAVVITPNAVTRQMTNLILDGCSIQAPLVTLLNQMDMQRANVNVRGYSEISSGLTPVLHTPSYQSHPSVSRQTITTDANFTVTPGSSPKHTRHNGTLTADRTVTISTTGAFDGMEFEFTRTGGNTGGPWNLSIGGLINLATGQWCKITYDGSTSAWYLASS